MRARMCERVVIPMPAAGRLPPPFINMGRRLTSVSCDLIYSVMAPACNIYELKVVPTNPGPCTCRVDSRACLEAASRVALTAPASGHRMYTDSRV
jgi:hypothetical protein